MSCYTFYEFAKLQGFRDIDDYLDIPAWDEWPKPNKSVERGYVDNKHLEEARRKIMQGRKPTPPRVAYLYLLPSEYTPKPNLKEDKWYMVEFEGKWGTDYRDCIYFYDNYHEAKGHLSELDGDLYPISKEVAEKFIDSEWFEEKEKEL